MYDNELYNVVSQSINSLGNPKEERGNLRFSAWWRDSRERNLILYSKGVQDFARDEFYSLYKFAKEILHIDFKDPDLSKKFVREKIKDADQDDISKKKEYFYNTINYEHIREYEPIKRNSYNNPFKEFLNSKYDTQSILILLMPVLPIRMARQNSKRLL